MQPSHHLRAILIAVFVTAMTTHSIFASPSIFFVNGNLKISNGSITEFEIFGTTPGSGHDQIVVTNKLTIEGGNAELDVDLGQFTPSYGDTFQIITYGSRVGVFDRINGVFPIPSLALAPIYDFPGSADPLLANTPFAAAPNSLTLFTTLPGDANLDLTVEDADLSLLLTNFGMTGASWIDGDFTGDRRVNDDDLSLLLTNFGNAVTIGQQPVLGVSTLSTIPEPATLAILSVGGLLLARRRRHRK